MNEPLLTVLILMAGFYLAWTIGANDVANAMGTSVGSGALTLYKAIFIAAILEFVGAFFFGSHVTSTMQKGIINTDLSFFTPLDFVLGMLAVLLGSAIWLQAATYFGWPVSTTHSIVGGIIGFGAVVGGFESVYWGNVTLIGLSWIISPIAGACFSFLIFTFLRRQILYRSRPLEAAKRLIPWIVFSVVFLLSSFVLFGGVKSTLMAVTTLEGLLITFTLSIAGALIGFLLVRKIKAPLSKKEELFAPEIFLTLNKAKKELASYEENCPSPLESEVKSLIHDMDKIQERLSHPEEYEVSSLEFKRIEKIFGGLQVISGSLMAFSHGANDVANAIGPLAAALFTLQNNRFGQEQDVSLWMLALGGFGIVVGLATWGWRVIATIGKKLTELTPTRGFSAEFSAAFTILIASRLGMPVSTTHTLVGAVLGVGLARGIGSLNLSTMRDILISWFITIPMGAFFSCSIFLLLKLFFK